MKRIVLLLVLLAGFVFSVSGQNAEEFDYDEENGGITITGYRGSIKTVVIPESINGLSVKAIGEKAFSHNRLTSIILPDTVTVIGQNAFSYNNLTKLILPPSVVKIDYMAFANNRLASIDMPASLTYIGINAFNANRIKNMELPAFIDYIGDGAFCKNLIDTVMVSRDVKNFNSFAFDTYVKITWH